MTSNFTVPNHVFLMENNAREGESFKMYFN